MKIVLSSRENGDIDIQSDRKLFDFEQADDVVLLSGDPSDLQLFLERLSHRADTFGMRFAPSTCKMLLQDGWA